jgi:RND family efflux transporter MFP subunit
MMRADVWSGWWIALAAVLLAGCQPQNEFKPPAPPQVTVARPVERPVEESLEFSGWTQATQSVDLRSRVNGYLKEAPYKEGSSVNKGDLLFVIEQEPFITAKDAAEAELAKADAAMELARSEYQRTSTLVQQRQAMTQADLDIKAAQLATAKANVSAAKAALERAELDLSYTEIRAPISGIVGRRLVDPGNLVQAEQTSLAKINNIDPIYAYFSVSESDLLKFIAVSKESGQQGDEAERNPPALYLGLANEPDFPRKGVFDFSERTLDRETGTALRRGVFPNADHALLPGMFVRVRAPLGSPQPKLLVEERAVASDQRGDYLLVVNDKKLVEYRPVKLGAAEQGMRVVESGVSPADWVVVNGLQRARPGAPVDPQQAEMGVAGSPAPGGPPADKSAAVPAQPTPHSKQSG